MAELSNVESLPNIKRGQKTPADAYLEGLGSSRSVVTISNCLTHIARILGNENYDGVDWSKLRRAHWQKVLQNLSERNCSAATKNLYLVAFKGVAREAWSRDLIPQSAYLKINSLKGVKFQRLPKGRSLDLKECRRLLEGCFDGTVKGHRDRALFAVMLGCGLRRAEVVGLQMNNWNAIERSFSFVGKGNKERKVFLPKDLDDLIVKWLCIRGLAEGSFFPPMRPGTKDGFDLNRQMIPTSIYRILKERAKFADLGKIRPHDLRRTFATRMLDAGCDIFILQKAMGHASVATTARYDYRGEASRKKICQALKF